MSAPRHHDRRVIKTCLALSLLVHLPFATPLDFFKPFQLGTPVQQTQPIMVDLRQAELPAAPPAAAVSDADSAARKEPPQRTDPPEEPGPPAEASEAEPLPAPAEPSLPSVEPPKRPAANPVVGGRGESSAIQPAAALSVALPPPLRKPDEFLAADWERLSYRISMWGVPVGTAELEAKQEKGEVRITLRIQSNPAFSQIYPVDDSIETRHIGGNFILSRIKQREGSFQGDRGFTLFLRDKSVFWIDRLNKRSIQEPLPNSAVLDILSGLYYLRNQTLEVGKEVVLQLFDSDRYVLAPVAVLRREHLSLPGLRQVDTLLVHPKLKTEGIFRRTGEILVWLTDDQNRVPVKVETRIALGKVTAELVSAESRRQGEPAAADAGRNTVDQREGVFPTGRLARRPQP